ncbi:MAG: putative cytochrome c oxidase subunit [Gemmatimonadetes bacterium]|nr:putative cytochrome c oxidase subunit [Gemmatimonadota bacterium]
MTPVMDTELVPPPQRLVSAFDASGIEEKYFGTDSVSWWGTVGFMVIEGFTLILCMGAYFYLRKNELGWPPERTPLPDLVVPTISLATLLLKLVPISMAARKARRWDGDGVRRWLAITLAWNLVNLGMRIAEFGALRVRWDTNAYGSIVWATLFDHAYLILFDLFETAGIALVFFRHQETHRDFGAVDDDAMYTWFLVLAFIPVYVMLYWFPRWT